MVVKQNIFYKSLRAVRAHHLVFLWPTPVKRCTVVFLDKINQEALVTMPLSLDLASLDVERLLHRGLLGWAQLAPPFRFVTLFFLFHSRRRIAGPQGRS
jgi:hypothetical protein